MALQLTPDQARAQVNQVNEHVDLVARELSEIQNAQDSMLTSAWQGDSATGYGNASAQHHDDIDTVISTLRNATAIASQQLLSISNADQS